MKLIDADKLLEKMSGHCDVCQYHCHCKHTSCGECDWHEAMSDELTRYFPYCGAKMDEASK